VAWRRSIASCRGVAPTRDMSTNTHPTAKEVGFAVLFSGLLAVLWLGVAGDLGASSAWFWGYSAILLATLVWPFAAGYRVGKRGQTETQSVARPRSRSLVAVSVLIPVAAVLISVLIASQGAQGRVVFGVVASLLVAPLFGAAAGVRAGQWRASS
jgi:hypothetical protein